MSMQTRVVQPEVKVNVDADERFKPALTHIPTALEHLKEAQKCFNRLLEDLENTSVDLYTVKATIHLSHSKFNNQIAEARVALVKAGFEQEQNSANNIAEQIYRIFLFNSGRLEAKVFAPAKMNLEGLISGLEVHLKAINIRLT